MSDDLKVLTPVATCSYPHLVKPHKVTEDSAAKWAVDVIFDEGENLEKLQAAVDQAIKDKWGDKPPKKLRSPFKDGDERDGDEYQGRIYISARTGENFPPELVKGIDCEPAKGEDFYAGCRVRLFVSAYAYEMKTGSGVTFTLNGVQFMGDGPKIGGYRQASAAFQEDCDESMFADAEVDESML